VVLATLLVRQVLRDCDEPFLNSEKTVKVVPCISLSPSTLVRFQESGHDGKIFVDLMVVVHLGGHSI